MGIDEATGGTSVIIFIWLMGTVDREAPYIKAILLNVGGRKVQLQNSDMSVDRLWQVMSG